MKEPQLTRAQSFIYAHACGLIKGNDWRQAAFATLTKIARFKTMHPDDRPPVMLWERWGATEQEIRVIAGGGFATPVTQYENYSYWIGGTPPDSYTGYILAPNGREFTTEVFTSVGDANRAVRQRIDLLVKVQLCDSSRTQ